MRQYLLAEADLDALWYDGVAHVKELGGGAAQEETILLLVNDPLRGCWLRQSQPRKRRDPWWLRKQIAADERQDEDELSARRVG